MEHFDIGYFDPSIRRVVPHRALRHRLVAWEMGREFYDGDRAFGYGGLRYDGRWARLLPRFIERHGLSPDSSVLEVGCKKGFLLHDLKELVPGITARGVESHPYPIEHAMASVKGDITLADYDQLPFPDGAFDVVIAFSSIYMLNLGGVVRALREIQRVGKGRAYITVGAYRTPEERDLFARWSLLGTTVLHVDEWRELFTEVGYTGDYYFTTAASLNLVAGPS